MNTNLSEISPMTLQEWQTWFSKGTLSPVFQPILSVETQHIFGYESLGRLNIDGQLISLGEFFEHNEYENASLSAYKRSIDRKMRLAGMQAFKTWPDQTCRMFINVTPSFMLAHLAENPGKIPYTLQLIHEVGIDPRRVVVEITEEPIKGELDLLKRLTDMYRSEGCSIAVDDVGAEASNLDRIGLFHPDIIKVDLKLFRRSFAERNFQQILVSLSRLSESLGSSLLFEGVETGEEFQKALRYGAKYIQGFLFAKPRPEPFHGDEFSELMKHSLEIFCTVQGRKIQKQIAWENEMLFRLVDLCFSMKEKNGIVVVNEAEIADISAFAKRMYFTDLNGYQISPNYNFSLNRTVETDYSALGRNWCFRPYYFDYLYKSHGRPGGWTISEVYQDTYAPELLRTFSRCVNEKAILFIDVVWDKFQDC